MTLTTNVVHADPDQSFTLEVTLSDGTFSWSVKSNGVGAGNVRNSIYGLTVNIGGNSIYIGDIAWNNYTPNSVLRTGTVPLANCAISSGVVTCTVQGNYYYGTWNTDYRCYGSGTITVVSPSVNAPLYVVNKVANVNLAGFSTILFSFSATPGSGGTITNYRLYQDGVQIYSGSSNSCTITSPVAGTHTYYVVATESNGATGQSSSVSITTKEFTPPSFISVDSVRWSTGDSSGTASDDGEYAKLTASYNKAQIDGSDINTVVKVVVSSYTGTISASGNSVYTGQILSPDTSYVVVYKLYDPTVMGEANAIIRTDIISIGGRGLDMIHDSSDGYGVAFGMKSTPGYVDSAMPVRVDTVDVNGTITAQTEIKSESEDISNDFTFTKTDNHSTANMTSFTIHRWGRVYQVTLHLTNVSASSSYPMWKGEVTISGTIPQPVDTVTGSGTNGSNKCVGQLEPDSANNKWILRVEPVGSYQANWTANLSFTFLV